MAGLRTNVDAPIKFSVKQTTNIAVFTNTVRIVLDATETRAQVKMTPPATVLQNSSMFYTDFRDAPVGNVMAKVHSEDPSDPDTDPTQPGSPMKYLPGWTGRWMEEVWHQAQFAVDGPLGNSGMAILTPELARDADHVNMANFGGLYVAPPPYANLTPPISGKMLRHQAGDFDAISWDAISPDEGNVDLRVRFRLWEPMTTLVSPWKRLVDINGQLVPQQIYPGHYDSSSNQMMIVLSMNSGLTETGNQNEVYGYALRNNWAYRPYPVSWGIEQTSWELVRFYGIQDLVEGQVGGQLKVTRISRGPADKFGRTDPHSYKVYRKKDSKVTKKAQKSDEKPDERKIVLGDTFEVSVVSGVGERLGGVVPDPGYVAPGVWIWGRLQKTLDGDRVLLKAKVWLDGAPEPDAWGLEAFDESDEAIQGGYSGIATATNVFAEPGMSGVGLTVGPADIDQVYAEVLQPKPGTSVSFHTRPFLMDARLFTPYFINTGNFVNTWWDEYPLNQTPGDWFILRPGVGAKPDVSAVSNSNAAGKPFPPDNAANFLVKEDQFLHPETSLSDRSNRSLEHATRDLSLWINYDPDDAFARFINPDMPRDALVWNEPYPGSDQYGHDGQIDDAEILVKFAADTWDNSVGIWLRASGAKSHEYGYVLSPDGSYIPEDDDSVLHVLWSLTKYVNGEALQYGYGEWIFDSDVEWYWLRTRIEGSSQREAARFQRPHDFGPGSNPLHQPHQYYPYGGVLISTRFWSDGQEESEVGWVTYLDDGVNFSPADPEHGGFSGYRKDWDESDEFQSRPYDRYTPVVPPIDRGFFGVGGPNIGTTQRYAEISVLSPRMATINNAEYEPIHNLVSPTTARCDAAAWTAENVTISTVADTTMSTGQALEVVGTLASAQGGVVRVTSVERVPVVPGKQYIALATLNNFQHKWLGTDQYSVGFAAKTGRWYCDKMRRLRVGLRWYDATGSEISTSWQENFQADRPPGSGPLNIGAGFHTPQPGQDLFLRYSHFEDPNPETFDLNQTNVYPDPYAGFAFPTNRPQPFRFQERWRWQVHGGALGTLPPGEINPDQITESTGWTLPHLHRAPANAVAAAVLVEIQNTLTIETIVFSDAVRLDYIGAVPRVIPSQSFRGLRDERYRIGEVAVFPALAERLYAAPLYPSWNVKPGEFAMPLVPVDVQATATMLEPEVHAFVSVRPDVMTATILAPSVRVHVTKPQWATPVEDWTDGSWTNELGSQEALWASLDELPNQVNDLDYIQSAQMAHDDTFLASLSRLRNPDPDSDEDYVIHYRFRQKGVQAGRLRVVLIQGQAEIASWEEPATKEFVEGTHTLTPEQVASLVDYADLRIELVGNVVPA